MSVAISRLGSTRYPLPGGKASVSSPTTWVELAKSTSGITSGSLLNGSDAPGLQPGYGFGPTAGSTGLEMRLLWWSPVVVWRRAAYTTWFWNEGNGHDRQNSCSSPGFMVRGGAMMRKPLFGGSGSFSW